MSLPSNLHFVKIAPPLLTSHLPLFLFLFFFSLFSFHTLSLLSIFVSSPFSLDEVGEYGMLPVLQRLGIA